MIGQVERLQNKTAEIRILHVDGKPVRTLPATIAAELGEAPVGSDHYQVLFVIGIFLFTITFVINLTAYLIVKGIRVQHGES